MLDTHSYRWRQHLILKEKYCICFVFKLNHQTFLCFEPKPKDFYNIADVWKMLDEQMYAWK